SIYPVISGTILLKKKGKQKESQRQEELYNFENTSELVDTGIYRYIRHPLYLSLILLTWGIFFKNMDTNLLIISILSTLFLYITARFDEKECLAFFGEEYSNYMKRSKMFIPFIF
ncbi:MAG: isoprenylcysteine carboxylmethyltransferase family protein, partial [Prolixibacteraceae bacterium]|nr:isoprenylcysteine carboxylmethyltransferase family protein [Prolixibacteraceae bacterium]MBN2775690.1 isoprenylcysteine carboxylmethyltransferase family protein [Prolixibacteraceae bacterium]